VAKEDAIAQATFIAAGINVLAVNRPLSDGGVVPKLAQLHLAVLVVGGTLAHSLTLTIVRDSRTLIKRNVCAKSE
jgi:hypothetical protein